MLVITKAIEAKAITAAKLAADVDGNGLTGADGAALAVLADGGTLSVGASGVKVTALGIGTGELAADAVDGTKIEDAAVNSEHIANGAVDLAHMSVNSVDSDQYVDASIDLAHMSVNSVDSDQYVDASIDLAHMSVNSVDSDQYVDGSIDGAHLSSDAVGTVLQAQFIASWVQIDTFSANGVSDDVSTVVKAAATVDTVQDAVDALGILTTSTTETTTTAGGVENYKVQIRDSSTEEPVDDGAGGQVYGVLSTADSGTTWIVNYYKLAGGAHTFSTQDVDILFAEVFDLDTLPGTAFLNAPTFGDITAGADHNHDGRYYTETELDAGQLDNRYFTETELGSNANANGASLIGIEDSGALITATEVEGALAELAAAISATADEQAMKSDKFTPTAAQTVFTLSATPLGNSAVIAVAGVVQTPVTDYTISGTTLTWLDTDFALETTDTLVASFVKDV